MRVMLKANLPVERANQMVRDGSLGSTLKSIVGELKPEAAYFTDDRGMRTAYIFFEMQDSSEIPKIAEPWFMAFGAAIELHPVMAAQDLEAAGPHFEKIMSKYG